MDDKGRKDARKRQESKDKDVMRPASKALEAEWVKKYGGWGWLNVPDVKRQHEQIPANPNHPDNAPPRKHVPSSAPLSRTERRKMSNINTVRDAMAAATGMGTVLTLSYKVDIAGVMDGIGKEIDEIGKLGGTVDNNDGELDNVRGYITDIEDYFNELSAVLAANGLDHSKEDDIAVKADEIRPGISNIQNKAQELKDKLQEAAQLLDEAKGLAEEVMGLAADSSSEADELSKTIGDLVD